MRHLSRALGSLGIAALLCVIGLPAAAAAPTAAIDASRLNGPAPFAVFFDAAGPYLQGDEVGPEWHDHTFRWTFGDPGAGVWTISGASKNAALGPEAAHVFDQPGTYQVGLVVSDQNGNSSTDAVTITVQDPDVIYGGNKTTCVSATGNFSGCPAGSSHVTSSSFQATANTYPGNGRLLYRRGESFSGNGFVPSGPGIIGAYGAANLPKPRINGGIGTNWSTGLVFMDLSFHGSSGNGVGAQRTQRNLLIYRVETHGFTKGIAIIESTITFYRAKGETNVTIHDGVFVVDCVMEGAAEYSTFLAAAHLAVMGNEIGAVKNQHTMRGSFASPGVIQHNRFGPQARAKSMLKMHAGSYDKPNTGAGGRYNQRLVISRNTFGKGNGNWDVNIGPQNTTRDERIRDVIIERNFFTAGDFAQVQLNLWATRVHVRNNVFLMNRGGGALVTGVNSWGRRGLEPAHFGNQIYNNTFYSSDRGTFGRKTAVGRDAATDLVANNLMYVPFGSKTLGAASTSQNTMAHENPFVSGNPVIPTDFALRPGSSAIDVGEFLAQNGSDYLGGTRPLLGQDPYDAGALEASSDPPPQPPILLLD